MSGNIPSPIKLLPQYLVDQIKAGEVIERPSALIKEVLENSLDAKATAIEIRIEDGGLKSIAISDNGIGMDSESLPLAFTRHATSKITKFEDLYNLHSFGFRGEALASIASISRVTCITRPRLEGSQVGIGGLIEIAGGKIIRHINYSGEPGTAIIVKDLFYNTPARLKFIKSKKSEVQAIKKIIQSYVINYPTVTFSIQWDDGEKEIFPAIVAEGENKSTTHYQLVYKRIEQLALKRRKKVSIYHSAESFQGHHINFYALTSHADLEEKSTGKWQYLFANKRPFTDKRIGAVLNQQIQNCFPKYNFDYVVILDVPESEIDVNVHPNKTELKFSQINMLLALFSPLMKKLQAKINPIQDGLDRPNILSSANELMKSDDQNNWRSVTPNDLERWRAQSQNQDSNNEHGTAFSDQAILGSKLPSVHIEKIDNDLYLYKDEENQYWLGKPLEWLFETIESRVKNIHFPIDQEYISPILIGIPFESDSALTQSLKAFLNQIGIEIVQPDIKKSKYLIRSCPDFLSDLPINFFLASLCHFLMKHSKNHSLMPIRESFSEQNRIFFHHSDFCLNLEFKTIKAIFASAISQMILARKSGANLIYKIDNNLFSPLNKLPSPNQTTFNPLPSVQN